MCKNVEGMCNSQVYSAGCSSTFVLTTFNSDCVVKPKSSLKGLNQVFSQRRSCSMSKKIVSNRSFKCVYFIETIQYSSSSLTLWTSQCHVSTESTRETFSVGRLKDMIKSSLLSFVQSCFSMSNTLFCFTKTKMWREWGVGRLWMCSDGNSSYNIFFYFLCITYSDYGLESYNKASTSIVGWLLKRCNLLRFESFRQFIFCFLKLGCKPRASFQISQKTRQEQSK